MGLFTPAWKSKDYQKAINAVNRIEKEKVLIKIAKISELSDIRKAAIKKITDQNALVEIAKTDEEWGVRCAAAEKITDQNALVEIAKTDEEWGVREAAAEKITDQNALIEIAKTAEDRDVREAATKKITDQNTLIEIAKTAEDSDVRAAATYKITDQNALVEIAKTDKRWGVREAATEKITDQNALIEIAKTDKNEYVRKAATEKITDRNALIELVKTGNDAAKSSIDPYLIVESDNRGTRIQDMNGYKLFLGEQMMSLMGDSRPFVQYTFDTAEAANNALLKLPYIHRATDSGLLVCSELLSFGVYRDENTSDREYGKYNAIIAGKGFTKAMYDQMCLICTEAGATKYGGIEPKIEDKTKTEATGNSQKVIFTEKIIRGNKTYFCYNAPSKADALAFLDTQKVTQPLHYVAVYTPEGKFGKDKDGGYEF